MEKKKKKYTPLILYACERGLMDVVNELIENGVNVNAKNKYGKNRKFITPHYLFCVIEEI